MSRTALICMIILLVAQFAQARSVSVNSRIFTDGDLIQIALDQTGQKRIDVDIAKDAYRPTNDGDIAVEPGEVLKLDITLQNNSSSSFPSVTAILKTTICVLSG